MVVVCALTFNWGLALAPATCFWSRETLMGDHSVVELEWRPVRV